MFYIIQPLLYKNLSLYIHIPNIYLKFGFGIYLSFLRSPWFGQSVLSDMALMGFNMVHVKSNTLLLFSDL